MQLFSIPCVVLRMHSAVNDPEQGGQQEGDQRQMSKEQGCGFLHMGASSSLRSSNELERWVAASGLPRVPRPLRRVRRRLAASEALTMLWGVRSAA